MKNLRDQEVREDCSGEEDDEEYETYYFCEDNDIGFNKKVNEQSEVWGDQKVEDEQYG